MTTLIYAPDLEGHPQVYCRVIIDALLQKSEHVVLACERKNKFVYENWQQLVDFKGKTELIIEDCSNKNSRYLTAEDLLEIQQKHNVESTFFVEADKFRYEFVRIYRGDAPRLLGRIFAIFARTTEWHPGESFYSGERIPLLAPTLNSNLGRLKRRLLSPEIDDKFFYEQVLIKRKIVDGVIVKDERVSEYYGSPVFWMPEIFRPFHVTSTNVDTEFEKFASEFKEFHDRCGDSEILLFFGRGSWYRGYDLFLSLLSRDSDVVGVHCGAPAVHENGKPYICDIETIRHDLRKQGRLFETGCYIASWKLIDFFYRQTQRAVSTHRLTASSGTVLQAMAAGKPVLVPDSGLLGYRNQKHKLGPTYTYENMQSLGNAWQSFKKNELTQYKLNTVEFMEKFSQQKAESFFQRLILQ